MANRDAFDGDDEDVARRTAGGRRLPMTLLKAFGGAGGAAADQQRNDQTDARIPQHAGVIVRSASLSIAVPASACPRPHAGQHAGGGVGENWRSMPGTTCLPSFVS